MLSMSPIVWDNFPCLDYAGMDEKPWALDYSIIFDIFNQQQTALELSGLIKKNLKCEGIFCFVNASKVPVDNSFLYHHKSKYNFLKSN